MLYNALGNNENLIAETLFRAGLAERMLLEAFASSEEIHAETREAAESFLEGGAEWAKAGSEIYSCEMLHAAPLAVKELWC